MVELNKKGNFNCIFERNNVLTAVVNIREKRIAGKIRLLTWRFVECMLQLTTLEVTVNGSNTIQT